MGEIPELTISERMRDLVEAYALAEYWRGMEFDAGETLAKKLERKTEAALITLLNEIAKLEQQATPSHPDAGSELPGYVAEQVALSRKYATNQIVGTKCDNAIVYLADEHARLAALADGMEADRTRLSVDVDRLTAELATQADYAITLQRIVESLSHGHQLPADASEKAPHHTAMASAHLDQLAKLTAELASLRGEKEELAQWILQEFGTEDLAQASEAAKRWRKKSGEFSFGARSARPDSGEEEKDG